MSTTYLSKIPYIKCDVEFGVPFIAFLGLIYSIWSVDYFYLALFDDHKRGYCMIEALRDTHYVFAFTTVYLLYFGFKDANKRYIRLWYNLKAFETVIIFVGVIVFMIRCLCYWPFIIVSILILGCGIYVIKCVKQGFNELPNMETYSISSQVIQKLDSLDEKKNPSPDVTENCDDETKIPIDSSEINNILRTLGFIKYFEFIAVVSTLFQILYKCEIYYDVNLILLTIGLVILFIIYIFYVYHKIPAYKSKNENINPTQDDVITTK